MSRYEVIFNVLGAFTLNVEASSKEEAYDEAVDAFFKALDDAGIEYNVDRRVLEAVDEVENDQDLSAPSA